jgi:hypothetical protein
MPLKMQKRLKFDKQDMQSSKGLFRYSAKFAILLQSTICK